MSNWKAQPFDFDSDDVKWQLDTEKMLRDVTDKMYSMEEAVYTKMIVAVLREKGYVVIEPEEEK